MSEQVKNESIVSSDVLGSEDMEQLQKLTYLNPNSPENTGLNDPVFSQEERHMQFQLYQTEGTDPYAVKQANFSLESKDKNSFVSSDSKGDQTPKKVKNIIDHLIASKSGASDSSEKRS